MLKKVLRKIILKDIDCGVCMGMIEWEIYKQLPILRSDYNWNSESGYIVVSVDETFDLKKLVKAAVKEAAIDYVRFEIE